jgi:hypothetical protein
VPLQQLLSWHLLVLVQFLSVALISEVPQQTLPLCRRMRDANCMSNSYNGLKQDISPLSSLEIASIISHYLCQFLWTFRDLTSTWGDNFANSHSDCTFDDFAQVFCRWYHKMETNEQVYMMNLQTIKQIFNEWMEEYYEHILNLANALEQLGMHHLLTSFFRASLLLYLHVATHRMK